MLIYFHVNIGGEVVEAQMEVFNQLLAISDKMTPEDKKKFLMLHASLEANKKITILEYNKIKYAIEWRPQPRQLTFLRACGLSYAYEKEITTNKPLARIIGYGGAAGGGKSDSLLGIAFLAAFKYPKCNIGYFRREYPQLEGPGGAIMRSQQMFSQIAKWNGQNLRWTFPTGAILEFCHCKTETDMYNYQSQQFDIVLFDEGTQFTRPIVRHMVTRNRATIDNFTPFVAIATNPGNVGHVWFKDEFVDIGENEKPHRVEVEPGKFETHIFIPAKLSDNQILETRDPGYRQSLECQAEDIRKMLLDGDFDVAQGRYFPEFKRAIHTVIPFDIPPEWKCYRTLDYGLDMLACYWIAVDTRGNEYVYKVARQSDLIISDAAKKIVAVNGKDNIICTYAPPDLWNRRQDTGKSAAEIFAQNGVPFVKSRNDRVNGWYAVKDRLKPIETKDEQTGEDITTSAMRIFSTLTDLIKCLISIQKDPNNPNDCANEPHELTHDPDAIRYYCSMRQSATKPLIPEQRNDFEFQRPKRNEFEGGEIDTSYINF